MEPALHGHQSDQQDRRIQLPFHLQRDALRHSARLHGGTRLPFLGLAIGWDTPARPARQTLTGHQAGEMENQALLKRGRMNAGVSIPISRRGLSKPLSGQGWRKDLLMSWLFQTCIRLQTSLDRRFLKLGMTMQEASVLLRCVEARRVTAGQLAIALGRDKSKVTRFIDRLEASHLLTRDIDPRDRRFSVLKPTAKAKRIARDVASVFDNIRKELF